MTVAIAVAMVVAGPIDLVKSRIQTAGDAGPHNIRPVVRDLIEQARASGRGARYFYRGVGPAMMRGIPV